MPYSELGFRFNFRNIDFYAGMTSLGAFSPKTVWKDDTITYRDTFNTTPAQDAGNTESGDNQDTSSERMK
jgi:hypothetical protein